MTGLLTSSTSARRGMDPDGRRPVGATALFGGLLASGSVLFGCMALALAAWFATDQGSHGTTKDALRIGSDAWLLAHGSTLDLGVATITMLPLGLTVLCLHVCFRLGRWAGSTSYAEDVRALALATLVFAGSYAVVAIGVALLASLPGAEPHLGRAFAGGFVVAAAGGGPGLLAGAGRLRDVTSRVPETARSVVYAGTVAALGVAAAGALLVAAMLAVDLGAAANVLSHLHTDAAGGALYTVLVAGVAPNAALFGASYVVGPGFAVGTGTTVSTGMVALGPVPAFPLMAALPPNGPAPWWTSLFLAIPVLLGIVAGHLARKAYPCRGYDVAAARGLGGGAVAGLLLGSAMALSGGAVGPGRMAEVGPAFTAPTVAAMMAVGLGALVGAVLTHWRMGPPPDGTEPTVDLGAGEPTVPVKRSALARLARRGSVPDTRNHA